MQSRDRQVTTIQAGKSEAERLLLEVRPSRWNFFWHYAFFFLVIPLLVAMWKRSSFVLRIYTNRISVEKRTWSRDVIDISCTDVRALEVRQSVFQRLVGIGDLTIGNAASNSEEVALGIPSPYRIKDLILSLKRTGIRPA